MSYRRRDKEAESFAYNGSGEKNVPLRPKMDQKRQGWPKVYWRHLASLLCLWICLVQYYEVTFVKRAINRCKWSNWEHWPKTADPHHMAVLADPQIMDAHSYPGRPWIVNFFTQNVLDNYHARNWKQIHHTLDPDSTFFLGDLFDGGRRWNDSAWISEYVRFNSIFPKKPNRLTVMSLPGNHDIGFGDTVVEESLSRFKSFFGDPSSKWEVGNHTIVLLDTISLSDSKSERVSSVPRDFLNRFAESPKSNPRILFTHVPLWRDPVSQTCGPDRESKKPFPMEQGLQYQTVIDVDISQEVLTKIEPSLVLSGDDHDFCRVNHKYHSKRGQETAEEVTVKSCAMNMGISRPAIQLLSLYNPQDSLASEETYHTNICYLPNPYKALKMYICTYVGTILFLVWVHFFPKSFNKIFTSIVDRKTREVINVLPIATKKLDVRASRDEMNELFAGDGSTKFKQFVMNASVMTSMIFLIFTFYYKQA
ncbi:LANO_0G08284g1_1 [Lachancea nothofagi CBS 11611]|uniref:LANO_0G08284g1_1 n=1 Tax=Lachancea nothofagi CBS 11611 TaxID=1266666 RepID=A0A1G4KHS5_9SACH|nr:LANO_0G08284g1_1 [Lachancea nothofagi CBS 11611]